MTRQRSGKEAAAYIKAHYGDNYNYQGVKTGDTLSIGKRTLTFVQTPMVHWPDNMVTYDAFDKILFSNDAFGQHFASSMHFDDETRRRVGEIQSGKVTGLPGEEVMSEVRKIIGL